MKLTQTTTCWVFHFLNTCTFAPAFVEQIMSDRFRNPETKVDANPCCLCVRTANAEVCNPIRERLLEKKMLRSFIAQKWLLLNLIMTILILYHFKIDPLQTREKKGKEEV